MGTKRTAGLMAMMFVQMMIFPVWFTTVGPYVRTLQGGEAWVPYCGALMGAGMFASPVVCMIADRFFDSRTVLAASNAVSAAVLAACAFVPDPGLLTLLLAIDTVFLMPTWSVASAIAMSHAPASSFPRIRACGSVGWACSAVFSSVAIKCFGMAGFDTSPWIFAAAAAVSAVGILTALAMPSTPPKAKGTRMSVADALGLRALSLLKDRGVAVLFAVLLLAMVPFQWYLGYNTIYLEDSGFKYLNLMQNLGQAAELAFMLALPYIMRKAGFKGTLLIGIGALAFRYACFYAAAATGIHLFDYGGILVHGLIFCILVVGVQMHMAEIAPPALRNQAQGLVMLVTAGIGGFLSVAVFDAILAANRVVDAAGKSHNVWTVPFAWALGLSAAAFVLAMLFCRASSSSPGRGADGAAPDCAS